jgi:hypothetical protein
VGERERDEGQEEYLVDDAVGEKDNKLEEEL